MHVTVPVRFGRGRLDSLGNKGLAAYLIAGHFTLLALDDQTGAGRHVRNPDKPLLGPRQTLRGTPHEQVRIPEGHTSPRRFVQPWGCWS